MVAEEHRVKRVGRQRAVGLGYRSRRFPLDMLGVEDFANEVNDSMVIVDDQDREESMSLTFDFENCGPK